MHFILAPIYFIYKLWIGVVFWITLIFLYVPFVWVYKKRERHLKAFVLKRFWGKLIRKCIFCPIEITLEAPLPEGSFIIASNHSSYLDTVFMYEAIGRDFLFVGKGELLSWPLFSLFFRKQDIPIRRGQSKAALVALDRVAKSLRNDMSVAIYPEGTIPDDAPKLLPFKNGAFKVAIEQQKPVVPVTWHSNYKVLLDPAKFFQYSLPQKIRVTVHAPIATAGLTASDLLPLRTQAFETIQRELNKTHES